MSVDKMYVFETLDSVDVILDTGKVCPNCHDPGKSWAQLNNGDRVCIRCDYTYHMHLFDDGGTHWVCPCGVKYKKMAGEQLGNVPHFPVKEVPPVCGHELLKIDTSFLATCTDALMAVLCLGGIIFLWQPLMAVFFWTCFIGFQVMVLSAFWTTIAWAAARAKSFLDNHIKLRIEW